MIKLPLQPVMATFQSKLTLFEVTLQRERAGRPAAPLVEPDRYPSGIIQPSTARTLQWAAAQGMLIAGGELTMHTKAPVWMARQQRAPVSVTVAPTSIFGVAPVSTATVQLYLDATPLALVNVNQTTWVYTVAASSLPGTSTVTAEFYTLDATEPTLPRLRANVGNTASLAGLQTYVRHAGEIWKAWGVGDWRPHQKIARYILQRYFDTDGKIK